MLNQRTCFEFPLARMPKRHRSCYFNREIWLLSECISGFLPFLPSLYLPLLSSQFLPGFFLQFFYFLLLFVISSSFSFYPYYRPPFLFWLPFFDVRESLGLEVKQSRGTKLLNNWIKVLYSPVPWMAETRTSNSNGSNSNSSNCTYHVPGIVLSTSYIY